MTHVIRCKALVSKHEIYLIKFFLLDCTFFWLSYDSTSTGQIRSFFITIIHIQHTHAYASTPEPFAYISKNSKIIKLDLAHVTCFKYHLI